MKKKYKYPTLNKSNFERMTDKLVYTGKFWNERWNGYDSGKVLRVRKPKTRDDFYEMTKNMYGTGLTFKDVSLSRYEIAEDEDEYSETTLGQLWDKKYSQYQGLKVFLNTTLGLLGTGGVARSHYGDYKKLGKKHYRANKRIQGIIDSTLSTCLSKGSNQAGG